MGTAPGKFRFDLKALLIATAATAIGLAVGSYGSKSEQPSFIVVALIGPGFFLTILTALVTTSPQAALTLAVGLLYGGYSTLALLPWRLIWLLFALVFHVACVCLQWTAIVIRDV